jgi:hypothetical protein
MQAAERQAAVLHALRGEVDEAAAVRQALEARLSEAQEASAKHHSCIIKLTSELEVFIVLWCACLTHPHVLNAHKCLMIVRTQPMCFEI